MSLNFKKILGLVAMACGLFAFVYFSQSASLYTMPLDTNKFRPSVQFESVKLFENGAYGRIKDWPESKACEASHPIKKLICMQGFYYVMRTLELNKNFNAQKVEEKAQAQFTVNFQGVSDALGTGIAASALRFKPSQIAEAGSEVMMQYLYEGWGYQEAISWQNSAYEEICQFSKYNNYCQFGVGRALFYIGLNESALPENDRWGRDGYLFSKAYDGKEVVNPSRNVERVALGIKGGSQTENSETVKCVVDGLRHSTTCAD